MKSSTCIRWFDERGSKDKGNMAGGHASCVGKIKFWETGACAGISPPPLLDLARSANILVLDQSGMVSRR